MGQFYSKNRHGVDVLVIIIQYWTLGGRLLVLGKTIALLTVPKSVNMRTFGLDLYRGEKKGEGRWSDVV